MQMNYLGVSRRHLFAGLVTICIIGLSVTYFFKHRAELNDEQYFPGLTLSDESGEKIVHLKGGTAEMLVPALSSLLRSNSEQLRMQAAFGLKAVGPAAVAAIPNLKEALEDKSSKVREAAQAAITRIEAQSE